MLVLNEVSLKLGNKVILHDISMTVAKGQITGILGANGAGKSTLLKVITGEYPHYLGQIMIDGECLSQMPRITLSQKMAFVSQHEQVLGDIKVIDYVLLGRLAYCNGDFKEKDYAKAMKALSLLDSSCFCTKNYMQLSGGERQRVQLARALVQLSQENSEYEGYLLLDEYSAHMDIYYQRQTLNILSNLAKKYELGVLVIGHDLNIALQYYQESVLLKNGQMLGFNKTENLLVSNYIYQAFQTQAELIELKNKNSKVIVLS
ncbi:ABC transporter ATP-binding protein [Fastidiosibacter lacustris]|uniref:ABC transporter ATP-binding protein n=1 Tax=Fastidiosibacter lacustris TaxID=2056695 RepID=UPI000E346824|nr:ABC transporter ATP-binding protein [Fastidiosibacter lacustris]